MAQAAPSTGTASRRSLTRGHAREQPLHSAQPLRSVSGPSSAQWPGLPPRNPSQRPPQTAASNRRYGPSERRRREPHAILGPPPADSNESSATTAHLGAPVEQGLLRLPPARSPRDEDHANSPSLGLTTRSTPTSPAPGYAGHRGPFRTRNRSAAASGPARASAKRCTPSPSFPLPGGRTRLAAASGGAGTWRHGQAAAVPGGGRGADGGRLSGPGAVPAVDAPRLPR
ncbi:UPF0711 protein C18orf21 homolog isoform X2 [Pogoniulus pusillus]